MLSNRNGSISLATASRPRFTRRKEPLIYEDGFVNRWILVLGVLRLMLEARVEFRTGAQSSIR
jgi:hypothetical protein